MRVYLPVDDFDFSNLASKCKNDTILAERVFHVSDPTGELEFLLKGTQVVTQKIYDRFKFAKEHINKKFGDFDMITREQIRVFPGEYKLNEEENRSFSKDGQWLLEFPTLEIFNTRESFCNFMWNEFIQSPDNLTIKITPNFSSATLTDDTFFELFSKHWE